MIVQELSVNFGSVLGPAIRVMDTAGGPPLLDRPRQSSNRQARVDRATDGITDHAA